MLRGKLRENIFNPCPKLTNDRTENMNEIEHRLVSAIELNKNNIRPDVKNKTLV